MNVENEAFQHYLQTQRNLIDDHDMGLREMTWDESFMSDMTRLLESDTTKENAFIEIRRMLALATTGAQNNTTDDIPEYSCSELAIYTARRLLLGNIGPLVSEPNNIRKYVTWNGGTLRECMAN